MEKKVRSLVLLASFFLFIYLLVLFASSFYLFIYFFNEVTCYLDSRYSSLRVMCSIFSLSLSLRGWESFLEPEFVFVSRARILCSLIVNCVFVPYVLEI